ncbi:hypothetical protein [Paraliomyxa miuraensis]|uniref:hypothetical protein n=1 Tax=Paraliomyxa miuraensis TaxID=376150 RepID=UPI00224EDEA1|nr:hypothetical protein [Paraliomyxa miuraensis]MCX4239269.1 hypothetical protein [Paraliomyxa miuraensis]
MAEDKGSAAWPILKLGLIGLGGLVAIGIVASILKPLLILGVIAGAGYVGYRLFMGSEKAIEGPKERKALGADVDFERKMRELDAIDRKLDEEIRKNS